MNTPPQSRRSPKLAAHNPTSAEIQKYLPLVGHAVARFVRRLPPNVQGDDLFAAGVYGLFDSLRKGTEDRGPAFEWYLRIRIRGAILDELRAQDWLSRRARKGVQAANASEGGGPSARVVVGFDDLSERGHAATLTDEDAKTPHQLVEQRMERAALVKAVEQLPPRERRIVSLHYFQDVHFKTIAAELGVSEPRVSQLHARAMTRLKSLLVTEIDVAA